MSAADKGIYLEKDGTWGIDKMVRGQRIRVCTGSTDRENAVAILKHRVHLFTKQNARTDWQQFVEEFCADKESWIHKTYQTVKWRGKKISKGCTLSLEDLKAIALRTEGNCEITGIPFTRKLRGERSGPFVMSLDRIDSKWGYTASNCRIVCLSVNLAMRDWGEEVIVKIGKAMTLKALQKEVRETSWLEPVTTDLPSGNENGLVL